MGMRLASVSGPDDRLAGVWAAGCDEAMAFSSIAAVAPGIAFARIEGTTTAHVRGPETWAATLSCPSGSEFFGAEFRRGVYLPMFAPGDLVNRQDAVLPVLPDGRILLDGESWELPTPENLDVFVERLGRAGLLRFDPLVEELCHDERPRGIAERTAQARFVRALGVSRRTVRVIERARAAATDLRAGTPIADVVAKGGYYDQPHLTRVMKRLIGYSPAELARTPDFLNL